MSEKSGARKLAQRSTRVPMTASVAARKGKAAKMWRRRLAALGCPYHARRDRRRGKERRAVSEVTIETIVNLCKRRGIVFPSSEVYGGLRSAWEYGPLGGEVKRNGMAQWWRAMV